MQGAYGVNLTRYNTFAGDLMVHYPQFRQIPGMDDAMVIVDFPYLKYRHLDGRDTALYENRQGNGVDGVIHEYLTECGLELLQDKTHVYIKNWSSNTRKRTTRPFAIDTLVVKPCYHPFFIGDLHRQRQRPKASRQEESCCT